MLTSIARNKYLRWVMEISISWEFNYLSLHTVAPFSTSAACQRYNDKINTTRYLKQTKVCNEKASVKCQIIYIYATYTQERI
jgi:hypothetical protein